MSISSIEQLDQAIVSGVKIALNDPNGAALSQLLHEEPKSPEFTRLIVASEKDCAKS